MKNAAIGIIFNKERNHVLLIKRRDISIWVLPGGGIEDGEVAEAAVTRELLEETGVMTVIRRKIAEYTPINRLAKFTHLFECEILGGSFTVGDETKEVKFQPIENLPKDFFHIHQEWLQDALKNEAFIIQKEITSVTYWRLFHYFFRHPVRVIRALLSRIGLPINRCSP